MQSRRKIFTAILILFPIATAELLFRLYFHKTFHMPFLWPRQIVHWYFPGVITTRYADIKKDDRTFDVLMLGGSTLHPGFGKIEAYLKERLEHELNRTVRTHNLAAGGHCSLDSRRKYELVHHQPFDMILFYDGINETRTNNAPDEVFKEDYSHYYWYEDISTIFAHPELRFTIIPYTLHFAYNRIKSTVIKDRKTPFTVHKKPEWLVYGAKIKSAQPFYRNLKTIAEIAGGHEVPIIAPLFGYSRPGLGKISEYGITPNVIAGIQAHNQMTQRVADEFDHVYTFGLDRQLMSDLKNFVDECHVSEKGAELFVNATIEEMKKNGTVERFLTRTASNQISDGS